MSLLVYVQGVSTCVTAVALAFIAAIGAWISYQQARTARRKLRLDMFPLRISVYNTVAEAVVSALNRNHTQVADETTVILNAKVREARFLFDATVFNYLNKIETAILHVRSGNIMERNGNLYANQNLIDQYNDDCKLLLESLRELVVKLEASMKLDDNQSFSLVLDRSPKRLST